MILKLFLVVITLFSHSTWCEMTPEQKLKALRDEMRNGGIHAYIVPSEDEHQSEYVAECDKKRKFISGFTGSAGTAVITLNKAALWTDSRYYLRAEKELNNTEWILMKGSDSGTPSINDWILSQLNESNIVLQNSKLVSISAWRARTTSFASKNIVFEDRGVDLVDKVWTDRPTRPYGKINAHKLEFSGESWQDKVKKVQSKINETKVDLYVVTALDEVAWLFNMRSSDIPYNPMFFAYAIVNRNGNPKIFINVTRIETDPDLVKHLEGVDLLPYENITDEISSLSSEGKIIWISPMSSYAIFNAVTNKTLLINDKPSPVRSLKAVKNPTEIAQARLCQIRDSAARVRHMYWLENQVKKGLKVTEVSSAQKLEEIQSQVENFKSLSFDSISAVGPHAADIHFFTNEEENQDINDKRIYLLDAGAQYEGCTTDITRTHHFGKPTPKEILAYTKVMQGSIDLANLVFPRNVNGRLIDVAARAPLWRAGLDYGHGTGHGIGYYLSVHENPPYGSTLYDENYVPGMFQSDEPGYYEPGSFGIRLETDLEVVEANTTYNFNGIRYLKFEAQSLVPFDRNLIDVNLLSRSQIEWLNNYNLRIRKHVGDIFSKNKENDHYDYLMKLTEPISTTVFSNARIFSISKIIYLLPVLTLFLF